MLIDDGRLEQVDGRWVAVGDLDTVNVPPGIHALLQLDWSALAPKSAPCSVVPP